MSFELPLTIHPDDIDLLGHVNNVTYLRWVQEAATAHWDVLATPEDHARLLWVVLRHEIDYKHPALPGDALLAKTWVGAAHGLRFERFTEILRAADRKVMATAKTLWCPVDAKTLRPARLSDFTASRYTAPSKPT